MPFALESGGILAFALRTGKPCHSMHEGGKGASSFRGYAFPVLDCADEEFRL
jgi:hypothetical protein